MMEMNTWTLDNANQEDKCRVCGGDGSACETTSNVIKDQDMTMGYNDLVMIPPGATNIRIAEVKDIYINLIVLTPL